MLEKNTKKHLSVILLVLILFAISPLNVIAVNDSRESTFLISTNCSSCEVGRIIGKIRTDKYILGIEPCGHSAKCDVEKTKIIIQSWTQCTVRGCYHSEVTTNDQTKYIHTKCGR